MDALQEAMDNVDRSLSEVNQAAEVEKFPDELFLDTLESSEKRLMKIFTENDEELRRIEERRKALEEANENIKRFLMGIHAAKTEISRP